MSGVGEKACGTRTTPADFLKSIRGRPVVVKLNSGVDYRANQDIFSSPVSKKLCLRPYALWILRGILNVDDSFVKSNSFLHEMTGPIVFAGSLACLDGYMNIAMEQTEEYVNGQLKNKYGDAFIRGNNVLYISSTNRTLADEA